MEGIYRVVYLDTQSAPVPWGAPFQRFDKGALEGLGFWAPGLKGRGIGVFVRDGALGLESCGRAQSQASPGPYSVVSF